MTTGRLTVLWLLAVFCVGLGKLALLPPFEAFDEAQYWSAVQQFADTGGLPPYGHARISADVAAYPGPVPSITGQPYAAFFARTAAADPLAQAGPSRYVPATAINYETQHPPLFFALIAPLYRSVAGLGWRAQFLALRTANWTIAFSGFCLGALATRSALRRRGAPAAILMLPLLWPFLFPQFFEEFTRITNDTLCFALVSAVWFVVVRRLDLGAMTWRRALGLGVLLGAGLLTKAFFLPFGAGVLLLLGLAAWRDREPAGWAMLAACAGGAGVMAGWWYLGALAATGTLTGAGDFTHLTAQGGLVPVLLARFPEVWDRTVALPGLYLAGVLRLLMGFCWAGTWSFVHPPRWTVLPLVALAVLPCVFYARRYDRRDRLALAPALMLAPVLAGLLYHLAVMLANSGEGSGTPGWFFHLFAGPLSFVLALGWGARALMRPLALYAAAYGAVMAWAQAAFFSGCLPRAGRGAVHLTDALCVVDVGRLREMAYPDAAAVAFALAVGLLLAAATGGQRRAALP